MVPVCDKRYHIYNRFLHFWAEIKKLWIYPLQYIQIMLCVSPGRGGGSADGGDASSGDHGEPVSPGR